MISLLKKGRLISATKKNVDVICIQKKKVKVISEKIIILKNNGKDLTGCKNNFLTARDLYIKNNR